MDDNELQKKWPELKEKIIRLHPELTREELIYEIGKEATLLQALQKRLHKTNNEIRNWLSLLG